MNCPDEKLYFATLSTWFFFPRLCRTNRIWIEVNCFPVYFYYFCIYIFVGKTRVSFDIFFSSRWMKILNDTWKCKSKITGHYVIHTCVLICMCNDHNRLYGKSKDCMESSEQTQIAKMSRFESQRELVL